MNKVLDITQDIKDSLIHFVNCRDFDFAVSLGIIAGKRDYLNYDAWLRERILTVGNKFLRSLVRYFFENVFRPIQEQLLRSNLTIQSLAAQSPGSQ
jgi:CCR4-NOT transcription complex subunit 1